MPDSVLRALASRSRNRGRARRPRARPRRPRPSTATSVPRRRRRRPRRGRRSSTGELGLDVAARRPRGPRARRRSWRLCSATSSLTASGTRGRVRRRLEPDDAVAPAGRTSASETPTTDADDGDEQDDDDEDRIPRPREPTGSHRPVAARDRRPGTRAGRRPLPTGRRPATAGDGGRSGVACGVPVPGLATWAPSGDRRRSLDRRRRARPRR